VAGRQAGAASQKNAEKMQDVPISGFISPYFDSTSIISQLSQYPVQASQASGTGINMLVSTDEI